MTVAAGSVTSADYEARYTSAEHETPVKKENKTYVSRFALYPVLIVNLICSLGTAYGSIGLEESDFSGITAVRSSINK